MDAKTTLKKRVKNMTENTIKEKNTELHGKTVSINLKEKSKVKIVSVGKCPKCHKIIVRNYPIDAGVCRCESVVEVSLEPAIVVSKKRYVWLQNLANQANVSIERLVDVLSNTTYEELYAKGLANLVKK